MALAQPIEDDAPGTVIRFGGALFVPLASGALFWPERQTLLVADLHFEKMSSFARRGQLLPPYDTGMTLARLERDIVTTGARRVVALGDSFHRDEGVATLLDGDRARLRRLTGGTEWIWLAGNHDPAPHALGGSCHPEYAMGNCLMRHLPQAGQPGLIAGHLHPAARIAINGKSARRPCFVWDRNLLILPAYGASTGSLNILSPAFDGLFDRSSLEVAMISRKRVYPVAPSRLVHG